MRFSSKLPLVLSLAFALPVALAAQAPRHDPKPAAICRDGTRSAISGRGACAGHSGVAVHHEARRARKHAKPAKSKMKTKTKPATAQARTKRASHRERLAQRHTTAHEKAHTRAHEKAHTHAREKAHENEHARAKALAKAHPRPKAKHAPKPDGKPATKVAARSTTRDTARSTSLRARRKVARSEIRIATMAAHFRCKDGSVSEAASRETACVGHGGAQ